jgi:hypothetical protein
VRNVMYRSLIFLTFLIIFGCESGSPEKEIPEVPLLHPQASTIPQQDAIIIEWDVNTGDNLLRCRVYRSESSEEKDFKLIAAVPERDGYYEDSGVRIGVTYYYKISALDDLGNESDKSDSVRYTLLEKPTLIEPPDQAIIGTKRPEFAWLSVSGASAFTVRVHSRADDGRSWEEIWHSERVYPYQSLRKTYNDDNLALKPLESGMTCRWRVDSTGGRSSGSQSRWQYFSVISNQ